MNYSACCESQPSPLSEYDHPLSITKTSGLFPRDWASLIDERLAASLPRLRKWQKEEYDDPANWLVIPEFGVRPSDVSYRGFDLLISWRGTWGDNGYDLRLLIKTAQDLAQQQFKNVEHMRAAARSESHSTKREVALLYETVMEELARFLDVRLYEDDRVFALTNAATSVVSWALNGPAAAYQRILAGARRGGEKAASKRQRLKKDMVSLAAVIKAARAAGWPQKSYGVNKELARHFNRTPTRIGQILRDEKRKLDNELP